jgi:hypothetical protein
VVIEPEASEKIGDISDPRELRTSAMLKGVITTPKTMAGDHNIKTAARFSFDSYGAVV